MERTAFHFAGFVVSRARRQLLRGGCEVPLVPRYFDLLLLLIERRGEAVHRRELLDAVWSDVVVSDNALNQAVRTLRRALGDDPREPTFIRTATRHGYQFVYGDVREVEELAPARVGTRPAAASPGPPGEFDRALSILLSQAPATPYPGTALFQKMEREGRILHRDWDRYDTRHVVYRTRCMSSDELEAGYWSAYRDFYRWSSIWRGASRKREWIGRARHFAYAAGWKKFERLWDWLIRTRRVFHALPLLESVLDRFGRHPAGLVEPRSPSVGERSRSAASIGDIA